MNIIEAKSIYLDADTINPYQFMEKAGRTCYKSENNITEDSAIRFVQGLKKSNHTAMLEHSHIYLCVEPKIAILFEHALFNNDTDVNGTSFPLKNFFNITDCSTFHIISGSFRAFLGIFDEKFLSTVSDVTKNIHRKLHEVYPELFDDVGGGEYYKPLMKNVEVLTRKEFVELIVTSVKLEYRTSILMKHLVHTCVFTCDRGVTHEFVRHRLASFAQESSRYCNYSKDKFGNEITVIRPNEFEEGSEEYNIWKNTCEVAEKDYFKLIELGVKPQFARNVLPTSVKTELIITATEVEWQHILNLRKHGTTGASHPQIIQSMDLVYNNLCKYSNNRLK